MTNVRHHPGPEGAHGSSKCKQCQEFSFHQRKSKSSSDSPSKAFITNAANGTNTDAMTRISISSSVLALKHNLQAFTKRCDGYARTSLSKNAQSDACQAPQSRPETIKLRPSDAMRCARSTQLATCKWQGNSAERLSCAGSSASTGALPCLPCWRQRLLN